MDLVGWFGLWAPAKTPRDRIERIAAEAKKVLDTPEAATYLDRLGMEPAYLSPKAFTDYVAEDMVRQKKFLDMIGFVPQ
jgi:tripartite-type tricarboxylate transporter receptor subunit TctC